MPWNDDMNPWKDNKKSTTNQKDSSGDIEDLIEKTQDNILKIFKNNKKGFNKGIIFFVMLIVLCLWGVTGFYRVQEGERAIVLMFGKISRISDPGLRYHLPSPIEKAYIKHVAKTRINESGTVFRLNKESKLLRGENTTNLMLTGDENIIKLKFAVQWFIKDIKKYLFNDQDPEATVIEAAESVVREVIAQTILADALTVGKDKITQTSKGLLQQLVDEYDIGVQIERINLVEVNAPDAVIDSFRDVQAAKADKERVMNEAEAYRNTILPVARGDAQRIIKEAEASNIATVNAAVGNSQRFLSVLKEYKKAPDVTLARIKIENNEKILANVPKYIISGNGISKSLLPYFQLNNPKKQGE